MKKIVVALGLLAAVALFRPAPAAAHVAVSIGVPGFGLFIGAPPVAYAPPPVYYAPPVVYPAGPYYYPTYYRPWRSWPAHRSWYGYGHRRYRY